MKVPRYVHIHLNGFALGTLMALLSQQGGADWKISEGFEKYTATPDPSLFCARCGNDSDLYGARLSLFLEDPDTLRIQNVIAYEYNQSSCYRCNRILEGYYENIVQAAIAGLPVSAELTTAEITLEDVVGEEAALLLGQFSDLASKTTGSCHPCDRPSWFDFILAVNAHGTHLNTDLLVHTLEEQGWPPEAAQLLGAEFEFGAALLDYRASLRQEKKAAAGDFDPAYPTDNAS